MAAQVKAVTIDELVEAVGLLPEQLDQKCSDEDLKTVSKFLDWRGISPHSGLNDTDQSDIEQDGKDESDRRLRALQKWKTRFGFKATYRMLVQAYLAIDNVDHAERVCHVLTPAKGIFKKL